MCASNHPFDPSTEPSQERSSDAGFSLIEVIAAMVILALGLASLYPSFGGSLRRIERVDGHAAARQLAYSLLDEQTAARTLRPGITRGRTGTFAWSIAVEPAPEGIAPQGTNRAWTLYELVLTVNWAPDQSFSVETLHLARAAGPQR